MAELVVLVGNPRPASRTRTLAEAAAGALAAPLDGRTVLDLADLVGVSFGPEPARGSGAVADPFTVVREARLLVVATPAYKGTYTGLLKVFLDQLAAGALAGVVAVPVVVAASEAHLRSASAALRDLLTELGARLPAPPLAVLESALATGDVVGAWAGRHAPAVAAGLGVAA